MERMKKDNLIQDKSKQFAIRIINCYKYLAEQHKEYILSKQLLRCGTSIGANARESINAQSKADFVSKLSVALKEADETAYWLELLHETGYLDNDMFDSMSADCTELIKVLTSIIKTSKN